MERSKQIEEIMDGLAYFNDGAEDIFNVKDNEYIKRYDNTVIDIKFISS